MIFDDSTQQSNKKFATKGLLTIIKSREGSLGGLLDKINEFREGIGCEFG